MTKARFARLPTLAEVRAVRCAAQKKKNAAPAPVKARTKARIRERPRTRKKRESTAWVRPYVFRRERDLCRICGEFKHRAAESRHEIKARGAGGQITPENSIATCGSGTTGCHGFAQTYKVKIQDGPRVLPSDPRGAEGVLLMTPTSEAAAEWIGVPIGTTFSSRPLYQPFQVSR